MSLSRRRLLQSASALGVMGLAGCSADSVETIEAVSTSSADAGASATLDRAKDFMVRAYPETASSLGIDTGDLASLKAQLTDRSIAGQAAIEQQVRTLAKDLNAIKTSDLNAGLALDVEVVSSVFETATDGFDTPYGDVALLNYNWSYRNAPYAVAQNTGAFIELPSFLDASHSIRSAGDAESYLARMTSYAEQLDGETERVIRDGERGVILPDFLMEKTLGQLKGARQRDPASWGLVTSVATRGEPYGSFGEAAAAIARDQVGPALDRQIAALEALAPKASSKAGVWALPDGDAYYDWNIRASTTTNMSADEVHQMGLEELADLQARMEPILQSVGYTTGSVGERMSALGKDPRYHFKPGDPGRAEIMTFIEDAITDIRARMPQAFETLVPGYLEVTRISPEVEAGAPGAYGGAGSIDGTQPGHFWINLRSTDLHNKFNLADLTYHEAIPGHVWQGEYAFKQSPLRSMLAFNAYSEGWALYAQQIADELGVYDDFLVGRLGYLQSLAFRACRLVVDSGLHAKRWSREEANQWFVENNGSNPEEVRGEVDRYCAWPGQALGYKVGHSAINRLRSNAKAELGNKFDYRRFNDALVLGGSVPMTVLGRVIDGYIARESAQSL